MLFSKQTPASGGDAFAQFDAAWCYNGNGYIFNDTGTSLDVRIGASGSVQTVAAGKTLPIALVFSMAELYVRRTDQSPTQVTVEATVGLNAGAADGDGSGPVAASDITDAGTAGIAVLQAETTAQGRTALGVGLAPTPVQRTALSGTQVVLTEASTQAQVFTLTSNTTVKLPATGANTWAFAIFHGGGEFTLSINKADDTLLTALTAGDALTVVWDGTALSTSTALSTWTGSANLATVGTITTGTWHGAAIADAYIASAAAWNAKVSFPGFGTTEGTAAEGNDVRLSDARTPLAHNQAWSTITTTPTTLTGYGITDAQPLDSDLTALAGLSSNGLIARTADGAAATRTITGTTNQVIVSNGDGVAGNPVLSLPQDIATTSKPQFSELNLSGAETIDSGVGSLPAALANTLIRMARSDTQGPRVEGVGFASAGLTLSGRSASGTRASPSASGNDMLFLTAHGYDGTNWVAGAKGSYRIGPNGTWSETNNGTYHAWAGTSNGSTSLVDWMELRNGSLRLTSYGAGTLVTDSSGNVTATTALSVASVSASGAVSAASVSATGGLVVRKTENIPIGSGLTVGARAKDQAVSGDVGFLTFVSDDAADQLQGLIVLRTDATAANRRLSIECVEQGIAYRNITLAENGGNVGIGTTSPAAQLHLRSGSDNIAEAIRLDNPTDKSDNGSKIVWRNADISKDAAFFAARRIGSSKGIALTFGTAADWSTAAAKEKMRIAGNGNVGINNTNPQRKLDVVGDASGDGIRVTGTTGTIGALTAEGTSINLQADSADATRVLVDASANASGIVELNGGSSGYVQLGTGGTARMQVFANGNVKLNAYGTGTLQTDSSGNVTTSSDASLKTVTGSFTRGLADVLKLTPRTYHWNEKSGMNTEDENVGFIAQEVIESIPEAVGQFRTTEMEIDGKKTKKREKAELLTLSDRPLIAALVNAVKELKAENDALLARVSALENGKAAK